MSEKKDLLEGTGNVLARRSRPFPPGHVAASVSSPLRHRRRFRPSSVSATAPTGSGNTSLFSLPHEALVVGDLFPAGPE